MLTVLISGPVLLVTTRQGTATNDDGTSRAYTRTTARVLVASRDVVEVTIPDGIRAPIQGEDVEMVAEVRAYAGRSGPAISCRAVEVLPAMAGAKN